MDSSIRFTPEELNKIRELVSTARYNVVLNWQGTNSAGALAVDRAKVSLLNTILEKIDG